MHIEIPRRHKHSISLTPLIDVVFILLLFFMLATSFTDWREISLATGTTASADDSEQPTAIVRIGPNGELHYAGDTYRINALVRTLVHQDTAGNLAAVIIQPAAKTTLGPTVAVLDALAATDLPVALSRPSNNSGRIQP